MLEQYEGTLFSDEAASLVPLEDDAVDPFQPFGAVAIRQLRPEGKALRQPAGPAGEIRIQPSPVDDQMGQALRDEGRDALDQIGPERRDFQTEGGLRTPPGMGNKLKKILYRGRVLTDFQVYDPDAARTGRRNREPKTITPHNGKGKNTKMLCGHRTPNLLRSNVLENIPHATTGPTPERRNIRQNVNKTRNEFGCFKISRIGKRTYLRSIQDRAADL